MVIAIGADHRGFKFKEQIREYLKKEGYEVIDFGTDSEEMVDYPDYTKKVCDSVMKKESEYGIVICGSGMGVSIMANKFKGIRAVNVNSELMAEMSRLHNDANVLAIGSDFLDIDTVKKCIKTFLNTKFEGGRHQRRVEKIHELTGC